MNTGLENKMKKRIYFTTSVVFSLILAMSLCSCGIETQEEKDYQKAIALVEEGNYEQAFDAFENLGPYKDSKERRQDVKYKRVYGTWKVTSAIDNESGVCEDSTPRDEIGKMLILNEDGTCMLIKDDVAKNGKYRTSDSEYDFVKIICYIDDHKYIVEYCNHCLIEDLGESSYRYERQE